MLENYCVSLTDYFRLPTIEVKVGNISIGNKNPIVVQTMTTTDTMNTKATVEQCIRCIEAGAEMVRITAPSKNEADNLLNIKNELRAKGYNTPLIADIHFTPNAAETAARIIEKVRINPGNYFDKKKTGLIEYSDNEYFNEIERIRERFTPLIHICKQYGTAMRIGTNHGSLSQRIMSRYGDTPLGMVESALEFLRIARDENYNQIVMSMKSSNPIVMVHAYRMLVKKMYEEFGECYPLHLGVTEAGDGEDGRIKSAIGICTLLEDGIGDTIRVSLTEDPEHEIPVCKDIVDRYAKRKEPINNNSIKQEKIKIPYNPLAYKRRISNLNNFNQRKYASISSDFVPVVVADYSNIENFSHSMLTDIGYIYNQVTDKWSILDGAADYIYTGNNIIDFELPGALCNICNYAVWKTLPKNQKIYPILNTEEYLILEKDIIELHFIWVSTSINNISNLVYNKLKIDSNAVVVLKSSENLPVHGMRNTIIEMTNRQLLTPIIINIESHESLKNKNLIQFSAEAGALLTDGFGDGLWITKSKKSNQINHEEHCSTAKFLNNVSFTILQATRTRISKTEYISCPSCGRTLFDLQQTTGKIREATQHLKGVKIAIMGCIVNGPGEMADADFGYVGSGPRKITLYKGKDIVKKNVPEQIAVEELVQLLKGNGVWIDKQVI